MSRSCCPEGGICILLATGNGKTSSPGIKAQKEGAELGEGSLSLQHQGVRATQILQGEGHKKENW